MELEHRGDINMKQKKLAVLFPGVGYTCAKPLLYYTGMLAAEHGYEVLRLDYGQDIHTFKGRTMEDLRPVIELAVERILPVLEKVPNEAYRDILFISKSIGTVVSCEAQERLGWKVRHFLMTPIPAALPYLEKVNGVFLAGTGDAYIEAKLVRQAARKYPDKAVLILEGCNHSLEIPGETVGNIERLRSVLECLKRELAP